MKITELAQKWIDYLKKNPRKAQGTLDAGGGKRCCLGHLCYLDKNLKRVRSSFKMSGFDYVLLSSPRKIFCGFLPKETCKKVNLSPKGCLNNKGKIIFKKFVEKNNLEPVSDFSGYSLADINDKTNITHKQMGKLIELLYKGNGFKKYEDSFTS